MKSIRPRRPGRLPSRTRSAARTQARVHAVGKVCSGLRTSISSSANASAFNDIRISVVVIISTAWMVSSAVDARSMAIRPDVKQEDRYAACCIGWFSTRDSAKSMRNPDCRLGRKWFIRLTVWSFYFRDQIGFRQQIFAPKNISM